MKTARIETEFEDHEVQVSTAHESGLVDLMISHAIGGTSVSLLPDQARQLATALTTAAHEVERKAMR